MSSAPPWTSIRDVLATDTLRPQMSDAKLPLEMGMTMMVDPGDGWPRMRMELVGVVEEDCLLLHAPDSELTKVRQALDVGKPIVGRYLSRGAAFGFRTHSLGISAAPRRLLFLQYPTEVQQQNLRSSERVACSLPARMRIDETTVDGVVVDISIDGCQVTVGRDSNQPALAGLSSRLNTAVQIGVSFPGVAGESTLLGMIKNVKNTDDGVAIGIALERNDDGGRLVVDHFLQSVLLS